MNLDNCKLVQIRVNDSEEDRPESVKFYFRDPSLVITEYLDGRESEGLTMRGNSNMPDGLSRSELNEFTENIKICYQKI